MKVRETKGMVEVAGIEPLSLAEPMSSPQTVGITYPNETSRTLGSSGSY